MSRIAPDLDGLHVVISLKLQTLEWGKPSERDHRLRITEPRLIKWAIAAVERSGVKPESLRRQLENRPPESHWWYLRQLLPDEALRALDAKLEEQLKAKFEDYAA